jgi:hypothetical protein
MGVVFMDHVNPLSLQSCLILVVLFLLHVVFPPYIPLNPWCSLLKLVLCYN